MKKLFILKSLLLSLLLISCSQDETPYSYVSQPDVDAEIVTIDFEVAQNGGAFSYLVQASEMYVDWGDGSKPTEYVLRNNMNIDSVKSPIQHVYARAGKYKVIIYALKLQGLNLSKLQASKSKQTDAVNNINSLELTNCKNLYRLVLQNHPVERLDLSSCTELQILDCGGAAKLANLLLADANDNLLSMLIDSTNLASLDCSRLKNIENLYCGRLDEAGLDLISLDNLKFIRNFGLNGYLKNTGLTMQGMALLQSVAINNSNVIDLRLTNNASLVQVSACNSSKLGNIQFEDCKSLKTVELKNNAVFDASSMNAMFVTLPQVWGVGYVISLENNLGDATCNRSIATAKGWAVVDK